MDIREKKKYVGNMSVLFRHYYFEVLPSFPALSSDCSQVLGPGRRAGLGDGEPGEVVRLRKPDVVAPLLKIPAYLEETKIIHEKSKMFLQLGHLFSTRTPLVSASLAQNLFSVSLLSLYRSWDLSLA